MFAIAFDMTVADIVQHHPKGVPQAYRDIARALAPFGFERAQGSVYLTRDEDLGNLVLAGLALRTLPWLAASVRDIRGFKVEHWSDFTPVVKRPGTA
ncbi:MAG: virulence factor [Hyphomicrobiaceae bacterium]